MPSSPKVHKRDDRFFRGDHDLKGDHDHVVLRIVECLLRHVREWLSGIIMEMARTQLLLKYFPADFPVRSKLHSNHTFLGRRPGMKKRNFQEHIAVLMLVAFYQEGVSPLTPRKLVNVRPIGHLKNPVVEGELERYDCDELVQIARRTIQ